MRAMMIISALACLVSPAVAQELTVESHTITIIPDSLAQGDPELGGPPTVFATARLRISDDRLAIEVHLEADVEELDEAGEWLRDGSWFVGVKVEEIYHVNRPGYTIAAILGVPQDSLEVERWWRPLGKNPLEQADQGGSFWIQGWKIQGDTGEDDLGKSSVRLTTMPVSILLWRWCQQ